MNRLIKYTFLAVFIFSISVSAQTENEKKELNTATNSLFDICNKEDISEAAKLIAYNGLDKDRKYKSFYNINNRKEKSAVNRTVQKIKAMLKISDKYEIVKYSTDKLTPAIIDVKITFKSGNQEISSVFKFLKLDGRFVLAEIE
ncbi:MAG: hypothetical protein JEY94_10580 [Melioribacteraceae bacterium]|nr:hypothetical protein [Melioribacteraceae bacterium]